MGAFATEKKKLIMFGLRLMSAATFRRLGKIDEQMGGIQELLRFAVRVIHLYGLLSASEPCSR